MSNPILETLTMTITKNKGTPSESKEERTYDIPQGTVTEADLEESEGKKADAIVRSASGDIASYDDGGDLPMKSLKVNIVPKQSGSGDPSPDNVRPISGTDEVIVGRTSKNLFRTLQAETTVNNVKATPNADGSVTLSGTASAHTWILCSSSLSPLDLGMKPNTQYIISGGISSGIRVGLQAEVGGNILDSGSTVISTPDPTDRFSCAIYVSNGTQTNVTIKPMIRVATDSDNTFKPYNGAEHLTKTLPQTVYGGTLDVVSGKLVVETEKVTYSQRSQLGTFHTDTVNWIEASLDATKAGALTNTDLDNPNTWCNKYKALGQFAEGNMYVTGSTGRTVIFGLGSVTEQEFADSLSTPIDVVYTLKTPTEIDLTPTEVKSLLGDNNVWSDSGTVEVEYRADTSIVINKILEALA